MASKKEVRPHSTAEIERAKNFALKAIYDSPTTSSPIVNRMMSRVNAVYIAKGNNLPAAIDEALRLDKSMRTRMRKATKLVRTAGHLVGLASQKSRRVKR